MKSYLISGLLVSLLAACGGGGSNPSPPPILQVVSFGDSLSDVGTYAVLGSAGNGPLAFGGGRFTSNPGAVWTEIIAKHYGDTLTPAFQGGFGLPLVSRGGYGYAQGGADISNPGTPASATLTSLSVKEQVAAYSSTHGSFNSNQLILMQGGANDIIGLALQAYSGALDPAAVPGLVAQAATDFATAIGNVAANGGNNIAVINVADIGKSPFAQPFPDLSAQLSVMAAHFNEVLLAQLTNIPRYQKLVIIDSFGWTNNVLANYAQFGFKVGNQDVACNTPKILSRAFTLGFPNALAFIQQNGSSLLCSQATLTEPGADQSYMFADVVHPSSGLHALFAQFVEQQVDARLP